MYEPICCIGSQSFCGSNWYVGLEMIFVSMDRHWAYR